MNNEFNRNTTQDNWNNTEYNGYNGYNSYNNQQGNFNQPNMNNQNDVYNRTTNYDVQTFDYSPQNNNTQYTQRGNNTNSTTSIILGIIGFSTVAIPLISIPLSIVGLVKANRAKKNGGGIIGVVINSIALAFSTLFTLSMIILFTIVTSVALGDNNADISNNSGAIIDNQYSVSGEYLNDLVGRWNLKDYNDGNISINEEYIVTFDIWEDGYCNWAKYNDEDNNYIYGDYTLEKLEKESKPNNFEYYQLELNGVSWRVDGIIQDKDYRSVYEIGLSDNGREAVFYNIHTGNMMYGYKEY